MEYDKTVSAKKKALIITDGTEEINAAAKVISGALDDYKVIVREAEKFSGTDLLPADLFIIGCEKPDPASFAYLKEFLLHINLASRKCGVFSTKEKTLKYLCGMVKDCEASLGEPLSVNDEFKKAAVKKWLKGVLK
jgi:hypothetical protein